MKSSTPGIREHVGQFLLRHPQRFDGEEPVEQPFDVGIGCRDVIAIARKRLQLALLALQAPAERVADQRRRSRARRHRQQRAIVDRGLLRQQRHRVRQIPPAPGLLGERQNVGLGVFAQSRKQRVEVGRRCAGGKIAVPQRHVEGGMLAAHEAGGTKAELAAERERQQHERPALGIVRDDDKGRQALARSDLALPGTEKIEALIRGGKFPFEAAPDRLGLAEVMDDIDAGDAA